MNYPDLNSILLSHNHKYGVSVVLKWIITHLFLCNYSQFDKHRKPKSTFFIDLNPAPFLTHQGAIEHDGFHLKKHLGKESFISSAEQELSWSFTRSFWQENAAELSRPSGPMAPPMPIFRPLFWSWLRAAWGKLHLWVSQPRSVYFCIRRKGDGFVGGGLGQSKQRRSQHSKQTLPRVWTTHLEPYSSPTHSRSPLAVLFLLTPPFFFFLGPVKYTAYPRTCP